MKTLFAASIAAAALACEPVQSPEILAAAECDPPVALAQRTAYEAEVFFEFDRAELAEEGRRVLDDLARRLLQAELVGVVAAAQADRLGGAHYDALLSARRAEAIRAYLVEQGVPESVVQLDARGAAHPLTGGSCDGQSGR